MRSRDYGTPWPPWLEQNRTWLQGLELRQISMNPTDLHFFTLEDGFFHPYVWWSPEMDASPSAPRRRRGIPPSWLPSPEAPTPTANPPWPHQRRHQRRLCRRTHPRHRRPALGRCRERPEVAFRGGRRGCTAAAHPQGAARRGTGASAAHAGRCGACGGARRGARERRQHPQGAGSGGGRQEKPRPLLCAGRATRKPSVRAGRAWKPSVRWSWERIRLCLLHKGPLLLC